MVDHRGRGNTPKRKANREGAETPEAPDAPASRRLHTARRRRGGGAPGSQENELPDRRELLSARLTSFQRCVDRGPIARAFDETLILSDSSDRENLSCVAEPNLSFPKMQNPTELPISVEQIQIIAVLNYVSCKRSPNATPCALPNYPGVLPCVLAHVHKMHKVAQRSSEYHFPV